MTLFSKLRQSLGGAARKSAPSGGWPGHPPHAAWLPYGGPWRGTRSWHHLVREGYENNVIVHRSVRLVAECAASIPVLALRDGARLDAHPLLDLLAAPSPMQCGAELLERVHAFLALAGNAFVERVDGPDGMPAELHVLRPDLVRVLPGPDGWPAAYEVRAGELVRRIPVEPASGRSALLHLRTFHPLDDHHGLSALTAAAAGIEVHNAASGWNRALLENAARPSGALVFEPRDAGAPDALTEEQVARLRAEMEAQFQGPGNAGRPLLLEGGLRWQAMGFSPADMDFINAKHVAAREIALAFGVPPMLLGIPGDNTFANYQEANRALWRLTLLPMVDKVLAGLTRWLGEAFGDAVTLAADRDALPALAPEREALWARLGAAAFLTPNEKRAHIGLDPVEGGDGLAGGGASGPAAPQPVPGEAKANRAREQARVPAGNSEGGQFTSEGGAGRAGGRAGGEARDAEGRADGEGAPVDNATPSRSTFREDRAVIEELEGGLRTDANVPERDGKVLGSSGATIGAGVDLGKQREEGLRRLGVDEEIIEKVRPYLGRSGEDARDFLQKNPLSLTEAQARELTDRVHEGIIRAVARNFDRDSRLRFADLPSEAQTVIADVAIQFGANLGRPAKDGGTPKFWGFVTRGEWDNVIEELRDFKDDFAPRRNREADLLESARSMLPVPSGENIGPPGDR